MLKGLENGCAIVKFPWGIREVPVDPIDRRWLESYFDACRKVGEEPLVYIWEGRIHAAPPRDGKELENHSPLMLRV